MKSFRSPNFKKLFLNLPLEIKRLAYKNYILWKNNHLYPSIRYKDIGNNLRSVRIGDHYRAIGTVDADVIIWFWIGTHEEYNKIIKGLLK